MNLYQKYALPLFIAVTFVQSLLWCITFDDNGIFGALIILVQIGFYLGSIIPYGISIYFFKKQNREGTIWGWILFSLFILINSFFIYINLMNLIHPNDWPF